MIPCPRSSMARTPGPGASESSARPPTIEPAGSHRVNAQLALIGLPRLVTSRTRRLQGTRTGALALTDAAGSPRR